MGFIMFGKIEDKEGDDNKKIESKGLLECPWKGIPSII